MNKPIVKIQFERPSADVVGVLDTLGVRTFELVTHDIGIMVGYAVAATYPERVNRWVAIDAPLPPGADVIVSIRPELLRIQPAMSDGCVAGIIKTVMPLGLFPTETVLTTAFVATSMIVTDAACSFAT